MTITHARQASDDVIVAEGERYDVDKVLEAMCGIVDDYAAFAKAEGLAEPYTQSTPGPPRPDDDWVVKLLRLSDEPVTLPYGEHTPRLLRMKVMKEKEEIDAGGLRQFIEAPPYRFDLYPLGLEALIANFGTCRDKGLDAPWITCAGEPWKTHDPAPIMRIHRHLPRPREGEKLPRPASELLMTRKQRRVLTTFLDSQKKRGITFETGIGGSVEEPVTVRFPHAAFGAGHGEIRIALIIAGGD